MEEKSGANKSSRGDTKKQQLKVISDSVVTRVYNGNTNSLDTAAAGISVVTATTTTSLTANNIMLSFFFSIRLSIQRVRGLGVP